MKYSKAAYIVFFASLAIMLAIVYTLMAAAVKETTVNMSGERRMQLADLVPEGWAFFTRNPKEDNTILYRPAKGGGVKQFSMIAGAPRNVFGLNRYSRMVGKELAAMMRYIKDLPVDSIKGLPENNLAILDTITAVKIPNDARFPLLKGIYYLRWVKPVPWAWAKTANIESMTQSKIIKIDVVCSNEPH
jgi:antimicrobial peptide system SdpA family protein